MPRHNSKIPVYNSEQSIAHLITNDITTSQATVISSEHVNLSQLIDQVNTEDLPDCPIVAVENDKDVTPLSSILVSSIWNGNDDVFDAATLIAAVDTPKFKPINWMHRGSEVRGNEIIGVMVNAALMKGNVDSLEVLSDDDRVSMAGDLSGQVHIQQDGIIWSSYFPTYAADLQEGIEQGKLFVSMECFFENFGYALRMPDGQIKLVERTDENAYLSFALRAFGGPGKIEYTGTNIVIGRWIQHATFSGQGIVPKPANNVNGKPLSVILHNSSGDNITFNEGSTNNVTWRCVNFDNETGSLSVNPDSVYTYSDIKGNYNMSDLEQKVKQLEANLKIAIVDRDNAVKRLAEAEGSALQAQVDELATTNTELLKQQDSFKKENQDLAAQVTKFQAQVKDLGDKNQGLESELEDIRAMAVGRERLDEIKAIHPEIDLGYSVEDLAAMSDEAYTGIKQTFEKALAGVSGLPKSTDQTVSGKSKSTDQTVSNKTKLTEASQDETEEVSEAAEAIEEVETEDNDLLVTASQVKSNEVARTLVRELAFRQNK